MSDGRLLLLEQFRTVCDIRAEFDAVREAGSHPVSYAELLARAACVRQILGTGSTPIGVMLPRSTAAYACMWAAIAAGRPYVPLNPAYPDSRLADIVDQAGIEQIIGHTDRGLSTMFVNWDTVYDIDSTPESLWEEPASSSDIAYMLFTSGSTGKPKGVPISYDNLWAFTQSVANTIPVEANDICSQVCELSFDFSVHEIYVAFLAGATLCPARSIDLFNPARYAQSNQLTVWVSVPSLARVALANSPGDQLETVRLSVFNGEPLTAGVASEWAEITGGQVWNNYGPTECTVAATAQQWDGNDELLDAGIVSLGTALPDCRTAIDTGSGVTETGENVPDMEGELLLAGPQTFSGYVDVDLGSPFMSFDDARWYRTGDIVKWANGRLYYQNRADHQVKIGGHRIELQEIEHQLRSLFNSEHVAVIAHPRNEPTQLVAFVTDLIDKAEVTAQSTGLPAYMIPNRYIMVNSLPTTSHGKLDRLTLHELADK